jgi:DNA-binding Lrp family transcriptional regulator
MGMLAYLLISVKETVETQVFEKLSRMRQVKEVHLLFGEWDFIAKVQAKSTDALSTFVVEKIRSMPEIEMTSTLIVAR